MYHSNRGYKVLVGDGASNILAGTCTRLVPQGCKSDIAHHTLQQEVLLNGLLCNGTLYCRFYDKASTEN